MKAVWDYNAMLNCANKLDGLRDASNANKLLMDKAFNALVAGMNAETGKAFLAAYEENVSSVQLFAQILDSEAQILRSNISVMQETDAEIAQQIRTTFGV